MGYPIYSVYNPSSFESQAPFHPTPDGQGSIANDVIPTLLKLFPAASTPGPTTFGTVSPATDNTFVNEHNVALHIHANIIIPAITG